MHSVIIKQCNHSENNEIINYHTTGISEFLHYKSLCRSIKIINQNETAQITASNKVVTVIQMHNTIDLTL